MPTDFTAVPPAAFDAAVDAALARCPAGRPLVAAVSGGADSTALLIALARRRDKRGGAFFCLHVDHGLRPAPERAGDLAFVSGLCRKLAVPLAVARACQGDVVAYARARGTGIEAAARAYRLKAYSETLRRSGAALVLTAHTADDARETVLMRLLRGSGPSGLAGISERSGSVFRPLLALSRSDVDAYLAAFGVEARQDSTNADPAYLRNRIRAKLVPLLDAEFPFWRRGLPAAARAQAAAAECIAAAAASVGWSPRADGALEADDTALAELPAAAREEALFQAIDSLGAGPDGATGQARRASLARFASGEIDDLDLGTWRLRRAGGVAAVELRRPAPIVRRWSRLVEAAGTFRLGGAACRIAAPVAGSVPPAAAAGRSGAVALPLALRPPEPDDRIVFAAGSRRVVGLDLAVRAPRAGLWIAEDRFGVAAVVAVDAAGKSAAVFRTAECAFSDYARPHILSIL